MSKLLKTYVCQNCGAYYPKWLGKCNSCDSWNSITEEIQNKKSSIEKKLSQKLKKKSVPVLIDEVKIEKINRIKLPGKELNTVLGGGVVQGALILFGGEPGIGKSTLMLQMALRLKGKKILYISGEENLEQVKIRSERIGNKNPNCYLYEETCLEHIINTFIETSPELIIIDSIQTMKSQEISSPAGSISQVRYCTDQFITYAKSTNIPIFIIGHITKDGNIAGPKVLEHMVDVVLQFEGEQNHFYRLLKSSKNRFGSTQGIGLYQMDQAGLKEVNNPSELLINNNEKKMLSGASICPIVKGNRAFLIEIQALVSHTGLNFPIRSSNGLDQKRLNMLLAVLEKSCNIKFNNKDVYINVAGGLKISEPATDLAIASSVLSSLHQSPISSQYAFCAEISLTGEIRPIPNINQRIAESEKLGLKKIFISAYNAKNLENKKYRNIEIIDVKNIKEFYQYSIRK